jgi:hypothetical protein
MKIMSRVCGTILILINALYFIPLTIQILRSAGGGFGYGLLPITFIFHLFIIPSVATWIKKRKNQRGLLIINSIGLTWTVWWFSSFVLMPKI